jgi:outer membrane protein assembly factor BamB
MASRIKDRMRDFKKVFKENWKLFKQSKLGLIGLGIIIFFVIIAALAPFIPYAADRDPVTWFAPDEDIIEVQRVWLNSTGGNVVTVPSDIEGENFVQIYDAPVGLLSDGTEANSLLDEGGLGNQYLEVIYLSTGTAWKGVRDISPMDGTYTGLKGEKITDVIPSDLGPVVSSVRVYHNETSSVSSGAPIDSVIFITSTSGNVLAVGVHGIPPSGLSEELYTMDYTRMWMHNIGNDSISHSACIFYGNESIWTDDKVIVAGNNGTVAAYTIKGQELWNENLNGSGFYAPIAVDVSNMVVVGSEDGHFYGLDASTGAILWNSTFDRHFTTPYISAYYKNNYDPDGMVLAGTKDGYLY